MGPTNDATMATGAQRLNVIIGMATFGTMLTGMLALLGAIIAAMSRAGLAAAVCLLAAAVAFGSVVNAFLRR